MVPRGLRIWFVIHFAVDLLFAIPLMVAPRWTLELMGWWEIDPLATRLVAAALLGIGIESLVGCGSGPELFRGMLNLKIIWSSAAILGLALGLGESGSPFVWGIISIFVLFDIVWIRGRVRLGMD